MFCQCQRPQLRQAVRSLPHQLEFLHMLLQLTQSLQLKTMWHGCWKDVASADIKAPITTEGDSMKKGSLYFLDSELPLALSMLPSEIQQEGLWEAWQISVTMSSHPSTSGPMDQQALDKRNEPLRLSTRFKVDLQTIQVSVQTWTWLQMPLEGMLHSRHIHRLRVLAKEKRDQKQWNATCAQGEAMFLIQIFGTIFILEMNFHARVRTKKHRRCNDGEYPVKVECGSTAMRAVLQLGA